jgi:hypothetical protein
LLSPCAVFFAALHVGMFVDWLLVKIRSALK